MTRVVAGMSIVVADDGYEPLAAGVDALARAVEHGATAATGTVRLHGGDGVHRAAWRPTALTVEAVLADPRGVPPVWAVPASVRAVLDLDETLGPLAFTDAWLRALGCSGRAAVLVDEAVAERSVEDVTRWERLLDDPAYPDLLRLFLQKHEAMLSQHMRGILVEREVVYGRLRAEHQRLIARRDDSLRELDELRAAAAHHRAFLAHHGLDRIEWGSFNRVDPIDRGWGYARGGPIDRRYVRAFIASHSSDIRGRVLEVQEDELSVANGGPRVQRVDVVDVNTANARATIIADLRAASSVAGDTYDCIVLTQTAHVIDDMDAVLRECFRMLKPGGVLLATFPCVSRVCLEYGPSGDFWRVTPAGARMLVERAFGSGVDVHAYGNVKTITAFLHGLGEQELTDTDYAVTDPYNPMLVGVRAVKAIRPAETASHNTGGPVASGFSRKIRGVVLAYHRVDDRSFDPFDLSIPMVLFREHVESLQRRGTIVPLYDLLSADAASLPDDAVALTFDDGYVSHLAEVAPVLEELGVPATFFIATGMLQQGGEHWWDLLERLNPPDLRVLHDRLVSAIPADREKLLRDLRKTCDPLDKRGLGSDPSPSGAAPGLGSDPRSVLLDRQVRELAGRQGMTIGAHGVDHLLLPRQAPDVREREMRESRAALERIAGTPVTMFAYPYGGVDDATAALARTVFDYALDCTASPVAVSFDRARVPRLDVKRWTARELERQIDALCTRQERGRPISFLP